MTVAHRPQPSKASFMPQKRLKPLSAGHPVSPTSSMPSPGPAGEAPLRGLPAARILPWPLCCGCRGDSGDTLRPGPAVPLLHALLRLGVHTKPHPAPAPTQPLPSPPAPEPWHQQWGRGASPAAHGALRPRCWGTLGSAHPPVKPQPYGDLPLPEGWELLPPSPLQLLGPGGGRSQERGRTQTPNALIPDDGRWQQRLLLTEAVPSDVQLAGTPVTKAESKCWGSG